MSSLDSIIQSLFEDLQKFQTTRYARVAAVTIIFYDYVVTFDREVSMIWKSRWHFPKVIFLLNRYYILASAMFGTYIYFSSNVSPELCQNYYLWEGWTGLIACLLAEAILQMRIYAIYRRNRGILALMITCCLVCSVAAGSLMEMRLKKINATTVEIPGGKICFTHVPDHMYLFWIPILAFESLLFMLALIHGYHEYRTGLDVEVYKVFDHRRLSDILVRDSIIYFIAIGAVYLANLIVWIVDQNVLLEAPAGFSIGLSSALGSRLVLHLREADAERLVEPSLEIPVSQPMVFRTVASQVSST